MNKTLKNSLLCLKTEFSFQGDEKNDVEGNGFSSINKVMLKNNFILAGICHYDTLTCNVWGGDLLYLKNPEDSMFKNDKRKYFKLLNICYMLNRINFVKNSYKIYKKKFSENEKKIIEKYFNDFFLFGKNLFIFQKYRESFFIKSFLWDQIILVNPPQK